MRKVLQGSILLALIVIVATAGFAHASPKLSGSINFIGLGLTQAADQRVISDFEHLYPGVKVNGQWFASTATLISVTGAEFQAGNGPDVLTTYGGTGLNPSVTAYALAGNLADLSKSPWVKRIPPLVKPLTVVNGKPYEWMLQANLGIVMYNTAEFSRLGLKVPTTWAQLLGLCGTISQKAPGKFGLSFGVDGGAGAPNMAQFATEEVFAKDPTWSAKRRAGKTTFANTPGWSAAFQRLADLKNAGCLSPSVAADTNVTAATQFAKGQSLMYLAPTIVTGLVRQLNPNLAWSVFVLPGKTAAATRLTIYPGQGIAVNAHSSNLAAAEAFVNYAARQSPNATWAKTNGGIAVWDFQHKILAPEYKPLASYVDNAPPAGWYLTWPTGTTFAVLGSSAQGLLTGQKTIAQALADLDASWGK